MVSSFFWGSLIPLLLMIALLKKESRIIMAFFAWGLVAFVLSFFVNSSISSAAGLSLEEMSVSWAPITEELFKALPLVYFFIKREKVYPLFFFAMASGIGFSIQENYLYLISVDDSLIYVLTRSVTSCLMHGMTTAMIGYGVAFIYRFYKGYRAAIAFGLYTFAVIFHTLYNLYINSSLKLLGLIMPAVLYLVGHILMAGEPVAKEQE